MALASEPGLLTMPSVRFLRSSMSLVLLALLSIVTLALTVTGGATNPPPAAADSASEHAPQEKLSVLVVSLGIYQLPRGLIALVHQMLARGHNVTVGVPSSSCKSAQTAFGRSVRIIGVAEKVNVEQLAHSLMAHKHIMAPTRGLLAVATELAIPLSRPMSRGLESHFASTDSDLPAVIVADVLALAAVDIADRYNIPLVLNHPGPFAALPRSSYTHAPSSHSTYPRYLSTSRRIVSWLRHRMLLFALLPSFAQLNHDRKAHALKPFTEPADIIRRHILLLNTEQQFFDLPRRLPPSFHSVGPLVQHKGTDIPHSKLQQIENKKVLVVHLGPAFLEPREREHLLSALERKATSFKVWWVVRPATQSNVPNSFVLGDIAMLPSILSHPNVVAALVPCSAENVQEVLYHGKPVACIAVSTDQNDVAQRLAETQAGRRVPCPNRNPVSLAEATIVTIDAVLSDERMNHSAFFVGKGLQLSRGVHYAVDTIEDAAQHGTKRLVPGGDDDSPWHEETSLDVYTVYASFTIVSLALIRYVFLWLVVAFRVVWQNTKTVSDALQKARHGYIPISPEKAEGWPVSGRGALVSILVGKVGQKMGILRRSDNRESTGETESNTNGTVCSDTEQPPNAEDVTEQPPNAEDVTELPPNAEDVTELPPNAEDVTEQNPEPVTSVEGTIRE